MLQDDHSFSQAIRSVLSYLHCCHGDWGDPEVHLGSSLKLLFVSRAILSDTVSHLAQSSPKLARFTTQQMPV
jgi:hypothetical protein